MLAQLAELQIAALKMPATAENGFVDLWTSPTMGKSPSAQNRSVARSTHRSIDAWRRPDP
jgi:hypothetical protein